MIPTIFSVQLPDKLSSGLKHNIPLTKRSSKALATVLGSPKYSQARHGAGGKLCNLEWQMIFSPYPLSLLEMSQYLHLFLSELDPKIGRHKEKKKKERRKKEKKKKKYPTGCRWVGEKQALHL